VIDYAVVLMPASIRLSVIFNLLSACQVQVFSFAAKAKAYVTNR
jgi:hypothetical protein